MIKWHLKQWNAEHVWEFTVDNSADQKLKTCIEIRKTRWQMRSCRILININSKVHTDVWLGIGLQVEEFGLFGGF